MKKVNQQSLDLEDLIERYLTSHPQSEDTLAGIATFWLQKQVLNDSETAVQNALNKLIQQGVVQSFTRNHTHYYRLVKKH